MIPYDDLVIALQTWRARQGLPVAQLSGIAIEPPPVEPIARTAPPTPPPLAPVDTRDEEVDASLLEETHYENEGDDFAMSFGQAAAPEPEHDGESTSIGSAPPPGARDSFGGSTEPEPNEDKLNRNEDW